MIRLTSSVDRGFNTRRDWPLYLPIQSLLNWSKSELSVAFGPSVDMMACGARKDRKCATSASVGVVSECKSRIGRVSGATRGRYTAQRERRNIAEQASTRQSSGNTSRLKPEEVRKAIC